ncbi:DUF262 domain-containing protein [Candidatus Pacearchaeota archaeon]|nr:DUF262 domain-containing protein [Candidatus Pacearchaeota archaeon]
MIEEENNQETDIEEGEYENIPKSERKILTKKSDPEIRAICERIDKKRLIVNPEFQRFYVWENKPEIKSRLIESVLLNIPIPIIYTSEIEDEREEVIDGQQRITTFHEFKNNKFKLFGLEILKELNGKKYEDLQPLYQDMFLDRDLTIIKILKESQKDIKFEIFRRLNRGSISLSEQELRNCIFRGNFNNLIKELAKNETFLRLQGMDKPHKRMKDAERILRFFAFCDKGEHNYRSPLKQFLNNYIEEKRNLSDKELEVKRKLFKKCAELCEQVFGKLSFRRYYLDKESEGFVDKKINEGLMDIQLYGFMEYEKKDVVGKEQTIRDTLMDFLVLDKELEESIEKGTYGTPQVKLRTEKWFKILRRIIGYPKEDRRLYTTEEKNILFKKFEGVCQICKNKIHSIEDCHVDHIERYSEGGKTIIKNGQIAHRYCNLSKG